ncbi:helix-turn-helix transcriptional regulator [Streptomyces luteolifulvus]|uniref:Helix-turn-helix transcriptional regulator n=1 Tax=Streptomyces luteolifulvus TaxID=2615112 RepID=A0A6H9UR64_9ACTN|nr:helix-turn-helix transcriptional regulator [Streptomyces luteolifulvus]KAB1141381.1 helix-turn-helix transcriptional regulator [Streptomyces luteolifulvus]
MKNSSNADQAFGQWLRKELEARGYNLSPRGGGQTRFAEDSGISRPTISRLLKGTGEQDINTLTQLAEALGLRLGVVLVRAGILSDSDLQAVQHPPAGESRITPEDAATQLGITDEQQRDLFVAMTRTLQQQRQRSGDGDHAAEQ